MKIPLIMFALACPIAVGCTHEPMGETGKPVEGTPGATTSQSAGYDSSDPGHYHPQTDDTHQYHPASDGSVQPAASH